ncbi:MAG: AAA family ATPase [Gemmatimonadales bacterium]
MIPRFGESGTAGYIFGPEKSRKSMVIADIGLSVASNTPALGKFPVDHTGTVVCFFAEDPREETSRRVHRLARGRGIEVPANLMLIGVPALSLDNPTHQERLQKTLTSIPDLALATLDPMVRLIGRTNDNRAEELGPIHTFLRTLARECPRAVILLAHHAGKEGNYRGSTDYPAFGDFNLYLRKKDKVTTEVFQIDNRGGPPGDGFLYSIVDGMTEAGPTLHIEVGESLDPDADAEAAQDTHAAIVRFITDNDGVGFQDMRRRLRKTGLTFGNVAFSAAWKEVRHA